MKSWRTGLLFFFLEECEFYIQRVAVWDNEVICIGCNGVWINTETGTETDAYRTKGRPVSRLKWSPEVFWGQ